MLLESKTMPTKLTITTITTSLGFLLVQLDVSIVNVVLVSIGSGIRIGVTGLQWVVDSYALTFASLLLSAGALGDRIGARRVFVVGLLLFVVASLGCALAPSAAALIAARVLQGAGASTLVPCSLALLNRACRDDATERARAFSLWTAAGSIGHALGPVLGGALVTAFGRRSVFFVNLPLGAAGIWLAHCFVDEAPIHAGGTDLIGQGLAILSLFCLTGTVIEAGVLGWSSPVAWTGLLLAALGFCGFIVVEHRGAQPMLPLGFFRHPTFGAATSVGFLLNLTLYGALFVLGLYFQQIGHWSAARSGIALLAFAIAIFVANVVAGRIAAIATPRTIMTGGLLVAAFGIWLLRNIVPATPYVAMLPGLILLPLGIGLAVPVMTSSLLATVPRARAGVASGVLNSVRQAGGAIGVALFGAFLGDGVPGITGAFMLGAFLLVVAAAVATCFIAEGRVAMLRGVARNAADHG
jgi:DHA2 family methylenomycin A resistance protein-like MFS transporter